MGHKLLVYAPYYPPHMGGLENFAAELHQQLVTHWPEYEITVFTPHLPQTAVQIEQQPGIRIIRFPAFELVRNFPVPKVWQPKWWHMWQQVRQAQPDLLISHTRFFITSLVAWWHARTTAIPWIHIEHGSAFVKVSNPITTWLARLYDELFGRLVLRSSTITVAISAAAQHYVQQFDQRPTPVLYRGLLLQYLDSIPATIPPSSKLVLATAARLYSWKGIAFTIAAIKQLPPAIKEQLVFYVIGDGEDAARLATLAEPPIQLLGPKTHAETIGYLKATDIYIHSSLPGGGLATSLLEAMYCGCTIIATPNEGAAEVITADVTGIRVPAANSAALNQAIQKLIADPALRQHLGQRGQQVVRQKFDWTGNAEQWHELFQATMKSV